MQSSLSQLEVIWVFLSSSFLKPKHFIAKDIHSSLSTSVLRNAIKLSKLSLASVGAPEALFLFQAFRKSSGKQDSRIGYNIEPHLSVVTLKVLRARIFFSSSSCNDVSEKFPFVCTDTINLTNSLTYTSTKRSSFPKRDFKRHNCRLYQILEFVLRCYLFVFINILELAPKR
ncbi:hypothetical protein CDAR_3151 [Caerostris darwini]|uniref:Uncharacterized protein n=1 Tax=Caerostris darwini TaxID=1538125 RepID=A0AAV4UU48_9ARAC|nr:hypothetical protein CDAR_3151 [Caerostris darwini]